jgi:hypothetical protein
VGPRAGLDTEATVKILSPQPGIEPRSPGRPVRSQTSSVSISSKTLLYVLIVGTYISHIEYIYVLC